MNKVVVMTMNVDGLTRKEFRAILNEMGVEARPEPGIYQHISHPTETGFRIIETWESQAGFEEFAERRLKPAVAKLGIQRETTISFQPLDNFFGPRLNELPGLIAELPGGPNTTIPGTLAFLIFVLILVGDRMTLVAMGGNKLEIGALTL